METRVLATGAEDALEMLARRLGPDALLIDTRRTAAGYEMVAAVGSTSASAAVGRFLAQARALGFDDELLLPFAAGARARDSAADLWVRFVAALERRVKIAPPPHVGDAPLAVAGPSAVRAVLLGRLCEMSDPARVALVAADRDDALPAALARRHGVELLVPKPHAGVPEHGAKRLIVDAGGFDRPGELALRVERQLAPRGLVRIAAVDGAGEPQRMFGCSDVAALIGDGDRPGGAIGAMLRDGLGFAYVSASRHGPLEPARASKLCQRIVGALGRTARAAA